METLKNVMSFLGLIVIIINKLNFDFEYEINSNNYVSNCVCVLNITQI